MPDLVVAGRCHAVQYLRMSTEHQRYSLDNQRIQIAEYATQHGYDIVDTYVDSGRSGLTLKERLGLNQLLRDVTDPGRPFSAILVLDISRWGRFQNPDQHAAYEFLCRDLGVRVHYVSEIFPDDDSFASSIMKHIKRVMAGEYSRELSAKVAFAQIQGAARGFKQGGMISFGLRRLLIDADGHPKQILASGQRKSLSSDKVVVVPGPKDEQEIVRRIFEMFIAGAPLTSIHRHLNFIDVSASDGSPWSPQKVKTVLTNEIYTGIYVFNRTSQKLKSKRTRNPKSLWIRIPVCKGIITRKMFEQAQDIMAVPRNGRSNSYSSEKMLDGVKRLFAEKGTLSTRLINRCPYLPHVRTFYSKFGTIAKVYELVGFHSKPVVSRRMRARRTAPYGRAALIAQLKRALEEHGYLTQGVINRCSYTACANTYSNAFGNLHLAYEAAGYKSNENRLRGKGEYDQDEALGKLKRLFDTQGFITSKMVELDESLPTSQWYRRHFGSFRAACIHAGIFATIETAPGSPRWSREYLDRPEGGLRPIPNRVGEISDEQLFAAVRRIYADNGYLNSTLLFSNPEMPSSHRVYRRYSTLAKLYAAAGLPADISPYNPSVGRQRRLTSVGYTGGAV